MQFPCSVGYLEILGVKLVLQLELVIAMEILPFYTKSYKTVVYRDEADHQGSSPAIKKQIYHQKIYIYLYQLVKKVKIHVGQARNHNILLICLNFSGPIKCKFFAIIIPHINFYPTRGATLKSNFGFLSKSRSLRPRES